MLDMIAVGEILIDLVGTGDLQFSGTVGGAPCNALAQAAREKSRTAAQRTESAALHFRIAVSGRVCSFFLKNELLSRFYFEVSRTCTIFAQKDEKCAVFRLRPVAWLPLFSHCA